MTCIIYILYEMMCLCIVVNASEPTKGLFSRPLDCVVVPVPVESDTQAESVIRCVCYSSKGTVRGR